MNRRRFIAMLGGAAILPLAAAAQQSTKIHRVGLLNVGPEDDPVLMKLRATFFEGLRELGWIEGKNITVERRSAANRLERLPELAQELVRLNVDVIIAGPTVATLAAMHATTTIPIVMTTSGDPLASGLVESLARPGGNVTGFSIMAPEMAGKRLELLRELVPHISHLAIIWNATSPHAARVFKETGRAAQNLRIVMESQEVRNPDDMEGAFESMRRLQPEALVVVEDPLTISFRQQIVDFAAANQLPAVYGIKEFVEGGGLLAYGASFRDLNRRAAGYVDKILKGAKPADLPVQQPTKFELVINLKTAKALGITVPPTLLIAADEVIE